MLPIRLTLSLRYLRVSYTQTKYIGVIIVRSINILHLYFTKLFYFHERKTKNILIILFEHKQHSIVRCVRFTSDLLINFIMSCFSRFISKTKWEECIFNLINYVFNNFSSTYFPCVHVTTQGSILRTSSK